MIREIDDIIAKLELAESRDDAADREIVRALGSLVRNYTAHVDACFELAHEYLPGWYLDHAGDNAVGTAGDLRVFGHTVEYTNDIEKVQGDAPTKALAYTLAILKGIVADRSYRRVSIISELEADKRASSAVIEQVSAVIGLIVAPYETPDIEIDEDDHHIVLRWLSGKEGSFSLTFPGDGSVAGYLIHPHSNGPAWKHACSDGFDLKGRLNHFDVAEMMCKRIGRVR